MVFKVLILFLLLTAASRTNGFLDPVDEEFEHEEKPRFVKSVFLPPIRKNHDMVPTTTEMTLDLDPSFLLDELRQLFVKPTPAKPLRRGHGRPRSTTPRQRIKATTESANLETVNQPRPSNSHVEQPPKIDIATNKEDESIIGKGPDSKLQGESSITPHVQALQGKNLTRHAPEFVQTPEDSESLLVFEETPSSSKPASSLGPVEYNLDLGTTFPPEIQSQQQDHQPELPTFIAEEEKGDDEVGQVSLEPTTFSPKDPSIFIEDFITTTSMSPIASAPDEPTISSLALSISLGSSNENTTAAPSTSSHLLHESSLAQKENPNNVIVQESQTMNNEESRKSAMFTSSVLRDDKREIVTSPKPIVFRIKLKSEAIDVQEDEKEAEEKPNLEILLLDEIQDVETSTNGAEEPETTRIFIQ